MNIDQYELSLLKRDKPLFNEDIRECSTQLIDCLAGSKCLIIGAAGTIGKAVTIEIFNRSPAIIHAVDISENNMVELVRVIRSTAGYSSTDFHTFAIDCGSREFEALVQNLVD